MIRKIIKVVGFLIVLILVAYLIFMNIPGASVKSDKAEVSISADELYSQFVTSEKDAEAQFLGKVVEVTGEIDEKYEDGEGAPVVVLKNEEGDPVVLATLERGQKASLEAYNVGETISIKGLCTGMLMEVVLSKGIIEK